MEERVIFTGLAAGVAVPSESVPNVPLVVPLVSSVNELPVSVRRWSGELLSVAEVARRCECSRFKVLLRLKRGLLPERQRVGDRWYWHRDQLGELFAAVNAPVPMNRKPRPRKLSADDERELMSLRLCGLTYKELAQTFGVSLPYIWAIVQRLQKQQGG